MGVAVLLVGGVAYATIPGPDGVIHGCYLPGVGDLRVIDPTLAPPNAVPLELPTAYACALNEIPLSWNQTGPPGPPGPKGDPGGPTPAGSTDGFIDTSGTPGNKLIPLTDGRATPVASIAVPNGSYILMANTTINNIGGRNRAPTCRLDPLTGSESTGTTQVRPRRSAEIALADGATFNQPPVITLSCSARESNAHGFLTAIKVNVLHQGG